MTDVEQPPGPDEANCDDAVRTMHRQRVEAMAGFGVAEADIAKVLEIEPQLLRRYYARELDSGEIKANARVAESLFRKATGEGREAVIAAIFWMKTRAGWREASSLEITGSHRQPLVIEISAADAHL